MLHFMSLYIVSMLSKFLADKNAVERLCEL